MTVTFAEKLARIPGYQAGVPTGQAPEAIAAGEIAQLASNESPFPPHPKVVEAIRSAAGAMNRYPDPDATLLRTRLAERYETEPGRIAVGNGSCEILLAAAEALCEPRRRDPLRLALVLDVPLPGGADRRPRDPRAARRRRRPRPRRDGRRGHRGDPAADRLQPEQPDRDPHPGGEIAAFCERVPAHVTIVLDEAYIEFQAHDDPDADDRPARRLPQPGRPAHLQQVLRPRRPAGRLRDRLGQVPRRDRRGAPAVQRQRPRPGGRGGGGPPLRRRRSSGSRARSSSGSGSSRGSRSSASPAPRARPTSPGSTSATPTRARSSPASPSARSRFARAPRSAIPATCASPTARPPRTTASLPRSPNWWTEPVARATTSAVIHTGDTTSSHRESTLAALGSARVTYYWRFS